MRASNHTLTLRREFAAFWSTVAWSARLALALARWVSVSACAVSASARAVSRRVAEIVTFSFSVSCMGRGSGVAGATHWNFFLVNLPPFLRDFPLKAMAGGSCGVRKRSKLRRFQLFAHTIYLDSFAHAKKIWKLLTN